MPALPWGRRANRAGPPAQPPALVHGDFAYAPPPTFAPPLRSLDGTVHSAAPKERLPGSRLGSASHRDGRRGMPRRKDRKIQRWSLEPALDRTLVSGSEPTGRRLVWFVSRPLGRS